MKITGKPIQLSTDIVKGNEMSTKVLRFLGVPLVIQKIYYTQAKLAKHYYFQSLVDSKKRKRY